MAKSWYILAYIPVKATGEIRRKRYFLDINKEVTVSMRRYKAEMYLNALRKKLLAGEQIVEKEAKADNQKETEQKRIRKLTIVEALDELIKDREGEIKPASLLQFLTLKKYMLQHWAKPPKLVQLTAAQVKGLLDFIRESREARGLKLAGKTSNDFRAKISQVYNFYKNQGLLEYNPTIGTRKKKVTLGVQNFPYTLEQIGQIRKMAHQLMEPQPITFQNPEYKQKAFAAGLRQYLLFTEFMFYSLARPTFELRLLKVEDLAHDHIRISRANGKTGGRLIDIAPQLERSIQREGLRNYPGNYYVFGDAGVPGPAPVGENKFLDYHRRIQKALGWTDLRYTLYSYKHTGAIQMYLATKDLLLVMNMCGHTSVKTTETYLINLGMIRKSGTALENMPEI